MRYLVLSDIHANLEALNAVMADAPTDCDRVLVLGDLVGYVADPNTVVDRVRALADAAVIRGNHDKVAAGLEDAKSFNHHAKTAIAWTRRTLRPDTRDYLAKLDTGPLAIDDLVEICHGTPFDEDVYVFDALDARRSLRSASRPLCLFGHTHVPAAFQLAGEALRLAGPVRETEFAVQMAGDDRWLVNCGSVGQPRDGDWKAAYGVVDTTSRTVTIKRVEYDVVTAHDKILAAGLPEVLAQRLKVGR